jgi:hypothetical protein
MSRPQCRARMMLVGRRAWPCPSTATLFACAGFERQHSAHCDLARKNNLTWDAILAAEIAEDYKPNPHVYLAAAHALNLTPGDCMMVVAGGLLAAAASELRTGLCRPDRMNLGPTAAKRLRGGPSISSRARLADRLAA